MSVDESKHQRPYLGFVGASLMASTAAHRGMDQRQDGREEHALHAVLAVIDKVMPTDPADESPGAWARRGCRDGVVRTWEGKLIDAPSLDVVDDELYVWAYFGCAKIVMRVIAERARL